MTEQQFNTISSIVADNGYIEWFLTVFDAKRNYNVFSCFTDPEIMPIFKAVLIAMLKKMDEFPCMREGNAGNC